MYNTPENHPYLISTSAHGSRRGRKTHQTRYVARQLCNTGLATEGLTLSRKILPGLRAVLEPTPVRDPLRTVSPESSRREMEPATGPVNADGYAADGHPSESPAHPPISTAQRCCDCNSVVDWPGHLEWDVDLRSTSGRRGGGGSGGGSRRGRFLWEPPNR